MISNDYLNTATNFLNRHVAVHNEIFRFSIRNIVPLPFLFKKIDFAYLWSECEEIYHELGRFIAEVEENVLILEREKIFTEYLKALQISSMSLSTITNKLSKKSNNIASYNKAEYDKDLGSYQRTRTSYSNLGSALNEHLKNQI